MEEVETKPSLKLRAGLILGAATLLAIWAATWLPLYANRDDPRADGFEAVPLLWATITLLWLGVSALIGGISGSPRSVRRATSHLLIAGLLVGFVVLLEMFLRVLNMLDV